MIRTVHHINWDLADGDLTRSLKLLQAIVTEVRHGGIENVVIAQSPAQEWLASNYAGKKATLTTAKFNEVNFLIDTAGVRAIHGRLISRNRRLPVIDYYASSSMNSDFIILHIKTELVQNLWRVAKRSEIDSIIPKSSRIEYLIRLLLHADGHTGVTTHREVQLTSFETRDEAFQHLNWNSEMFDDSLAIE